MNYALSFAPHVPDLVLWLLIAAAVLITAYAFFRRARGAWARGLAFTILLAALANPLIVRETRQPLSDVVALVVDHTQSMDVHGRKAQADKAAAAIKAQLRKLPGLVVRETTVETRNTGEDNGTQLFAALDNALADVPPERVAGAIAITDGEVHDAPAPGQMRLHAPLQVLIAGRHNERD
ncbi:MAG: hypothetical protein KGQ94_07555, partial [Alphaproteobacteria bacterium]|nr:hypothetical protein [Alphaproteobacteria bacterium]